MRVEETDLEEKLREPENVIKTLVVALKLFLQNGVSSPSPYNLWLIEFKMYRALRLSIIRIKRSNRPQTRMLHH